MYVGRPPRVVFVHVICARAASPRRVRRRENDPHRFNPYIVVVRRAETVLARSRTRRRSSADLYVRAATVLQTGGVEREHLESRRSDGSKTMFRIDYGRFCVRLHLQREYNVDKAVIQVFEKPRVDRHRCQNGMYKYINNSRINVFGFYQIFIHFRFQVVI